MKQEIRLFFIALQFYTRLPIPAWVGYSDTALNQATRYFPLIGWIVGGITGLVWLIGTYLFDDTTALLLAMTASILTTGGFHEDGFADVCDGFGGGWTKDKIMTIMKDSRVGTYGVVGLILLLGIKFSALRSLSSTLLAQPLLLISWLMSAHALSRFMAITFLFTHTYVRDDATSKAKPIAQADTHNKLWVAGGLALAPFLLVIFWLQEPILLLVVPGMYGLKIGLGRYFSKWIGGYTGDCLGATQQICEVGFYLFMSILWRFI